MITERLSCFRERLKDFLEENTLTVTTFSEKSGIPHSRIYHFMQAPYSPSLKHAIKIADFFQCPLDYLFGFCNDFNPRDYKISDTVNRRVKTAIDDSKMTRYSLSKATGIAESQLYTWYSGKRKPALMSLITLAEALDCSLDFLAGRDI